MFLNFQTYVLEHFGFTRLPEIKIDNNEKIKYGLSETTSNFEFLKCLASKGFLEKSNGFDNSKIQEYTNRLNIELDLIQDLGLTDYFLLVWMVNRRAESLGFFRDYSRGSVASSLLMFLIDCTRVDSIKHNLILSRFISKVRSNKREINGEIYLQGDLIADVDINLGGARDNIVKWLNELYPGRICKISNVVKLTGKSVIKEVYKILGGASEDEARDVSDLIDKCHGIVTEIEEMPEKSEAFKKWAENNKEVFEVAMKLSNIIKHKSSHASGYMIFHEPFDGVVPIELDKEKQLICAFDMDAASNFAIKLDLLGLTANEIITDILSGIPEKVEDIELDNNPMVYNHFQNPGLLSYGLYQVSADCTYRVLNKIKPTNINELSDVNSISRPGSLEFLDAYVDAKENHGDKGLHPFFASILESTYGQVLYQEQINQMAMKIGFDAETAEILRRVLSKKKVDEIKSWKIKIYDKVKQNGLDITIADVFWNIAERSAFYSFNRSHSISTSYLSSLTVYLKYRYPTQFYLACLKFADQQPNTIEEITKIQNELIYFDIKLLPPNITKSGDTFSMEGKNIRFGLKFILGVSEKTVEKINKFRSAYANKFEIFRGAEQAGVGVGVLSALAQAGCLSDFIQDRTRLVLEAQLWRILTENEAIVMSKIGEQYNFDVIDCLNAMKTMVNDKGKPIIKPSRLETIRRNFAGYHDIYKQNKKAAKFANYYYERYLLGYSYSTTLRDALKEYFPELMSIREVSDCPQYTKVFFAGTVNKIINSTSKNGKKTKYLKLDLSDESGNMTVLLFHKEHIEECQAKNGGKLPESSSIVVVEGKKSADAVFADNIGIQDNKIFMKLSDLKSQKTLDAAVKND